MTHLLYLSNQPAYGIDLFNLECFKLVHTLRGFKRLLMKIPGNQPIFRLWPIQKHLHLGILESLRYPTLQAIPAIYGGSALYMVVMQRIG